MAEIYGCIFGAFTLGNATGRYFMAAVFDARGSYRAPLGIAFVALVMGGLVCFALGKYSRNEEASPTISSISPGAEFSPSSSASGAADR
jgi:hypothetical protein